MPISEACPVVLAVIVAKGASEVILPRSYGVQSVEYFSDGPGRDGIKIISRWGPPSVGQISWLQPNAAPADVVLSGTGAGDIALTWLRATVPENFVCALSGVYFAQAEISFTHSVPLPP